MSPLEEEDMASQSQPVLAEDRHSNAEPSAAMATVELVEGAYYWVRHRHENTERWTVARWEVGSFWAVNGREFSPRTICGPIPRPEPAP
jgi:hypothetical protein